MPRLWTPWTDDSLRFYGYDTLGGYRPDGPNGIVFRDDREGSRTFDRWLWAVKLPGRENQHGDAATQGQAISLANELLDQG